MTQPEHDDDLPEDLSRERQSNPDGASDTVTADSHDEVSELQDRILRLTAELENFRKRARREFDDAQRFREIDVLRDLLPVLDTLARAIDASEKTEDIQSLRDGFRMTAQQIEKLLASHGCTAIETDGAAFDPTVHDAIQQMAVPGKAAGTVVATVSRGFKLHDRVVRPAQVIVAKEN
jgi:molecular chaperone GrpE